MQLYRTDDIAEYKLVHLQEQDEDEEDEDNDDDNSSSIHKWTRSRNRI